jgi:hypothetical protein
MWINEGQPLKGRHRRSRPAADGQPSITDAMQIGMERENKVGPLAIAGGLALAKKPARSVESERGNSLPEGCAVVRRIRDVTGNV